MDCIFCKIAGGEVAAELLFEDEHVVAFKDAFPQAPTHILVIPRKHISSLNDLTEQDTELLGSIFRVIRQLAIKEGLKGGYRVASNCGDDGGQTVPHLHFHLLGGRNMAWPSG